MYRGSEQGNQNIKGEKLKIRNKAQKREQSQILFGISEQRII